MKNNNNNEMGDFLSFAQMRLPPHSEEAEQSVLGGLILSNNVFDDVAGLVTKDDFYTLSNRKLFEAITKLHKEESPYDLVTLANYFKGDTYFDTKNGREYLTSIVKNTPGSANIEYYSQIVSNHSTVRRMIKVLGDSQELCQNAGGKDIREILDKIESSILKVSENGINQISQYREMPELLDIAINRLDELFNTDGTITGLQTHLTDFDEITSGLQRGDLVIVAGRPSMGKTTFAMNIAENVATKTKVPVAVFSLEMPGEQLTNRMISSIGRVEADKIRTGSLSQEDWPKLNKAITVLNDADIIVDDSAGLSINELRARARRMDKDIRKKQKQRAIEAGAENPEESETGLGLIVIDYLQLMSGKSSENRVNEVAEISRGLKALAKELNIPVIALSQLNRGLEQRPDKRPRMADLRESGAIEQDADIILFVYRDEVYHPDTEDKGVGEIILGKHRNGSLGVVRLTFMGQYTRFDNHAPFQFQESY